MQIKSNHKMKKVSDLNPQTHYIAHNESFIKLHTTNCLLTRQVLLLQFINKSIIILMIQIKK